MRLQGLLVDYFGSPGLPSASEDETVDTEESQQGLRRGWEGKAEDALASSKSSMSEGTGPGLIQSIPSASTTPATKLPTRDTTPKTDLSLREELEEPDQHISAALLSAARHSVEKVCRSILSPVKGYDVRVDLQDTEGRSSLHWAALNGSLTICKLLLERDVDVEQRDKHGRTPLLCACLGEHIDVIRLLVDRGADLSAADEDGNSALHQAAISDNPDLVSYLLQSTANQLSRNQEGKTAKDLAGPRTALQFPSLQRSKRSSATSTNTHLSLPPPRLSCPLPKSFLPLSLSRKLGPDDFQLMGILGKGSFGEVFLVQQKDTGKLLAMKVLRKEVVVGQNLVKYVMTERNVLSYVRHPFIVALTAAFQTADRLFLLLDYCPGGDMGWHLTKEKRFSEHRARIYAAEVLLALEELHQRNIIFRDLKPENIVFDSQGHAKLTDFGLSREGVVDTTSAGSFCGSMAYLAPEVLKRRGHGKAVDWYLLGVLVYEMLVGHPPFYCQNRDQLFRNILTSPVPLPATLSSEAKSLIQEVTPTQLMDRNPAKRLGSRGCEEIKQHSFFRGVRWSSVLARELSPPVLSKPLSSPQTLSPERAFGLGKSVVGMHIKGWSFVDEN